MSILNPFYTAIAKAILLIHNTVLTPVFGANTGPSWALSIVLLVVGIRLVLFPLFLKQIRAQHAMQRLQPEIKRLRQQYKNDKEALNRETMKLYREQGANPLAGCLPLLVQAPIFYALYRVLEQIGPNTTAKYGFTTAQLRSFGKASVFGAPIASSFLHTLSANAVVVKTVTAIFLVVAGLVTFYSQRLLLARRNAVGATDSQEKIQKAMLYLSPLFILGFGFRFPLGVLLYWVSSYGWTCGQTFYVVKRLPNPADAAPVTPSGPPVKMERRQVAPAPGRATAVGAAPSATTTATAAPPASPGEVPVHRRPSGPPRNSRKRSKAQRRGSSRR